MTEPAKLVEQTRYLAQEELIADFKRTIKELASTEINSLNKEVKELTEALVLAVNTHKSDEALLTKALKVVSATYADTYDEAYEASVEAELRKRLGD